MPWTQWTKALWDLIFWPLPYKIILGFTGVGQVISDWAIKAASQFKSSLGGLLLFGDRSICQRKAVFGVLWSRQLDLILDAISRDMGRKQDWFGTFLTMWYIHGNKNSPHMLHKPKNCDNLSVLCANSSVNNLCRGSSRTRVLASKETPQEDCYSITKWYLCPPEVKIYEINGIGWSRRQEQRKPCDSFRGVLCW